MDVSSDYNQVESVIKQVERYPPLRNIHYMQRATESMQLKLWPDPHSPVVIM